MSNNETSSPPSSDSYAQYLSPDPFLAPAIVFTVVYFLLGLLAVVNFFRETPKTKVHLYLVVFGVFRTVAFALRSAWAANTDSIDLNIASNCALAGGFFVIVVLCFELLNLWCSTNPKLLEDAVLDPRRRAVLLRILGIAVPVFSIIGILGGVSQGFAVDDLFTALAEGSTSGVLSAEKSWTSATTLKRASAWGYFAIVVVFTLLSLFFVAHVLNKDRNQATKLLSLALPVGCLLIIRTAYVGAAIEVGNTNGVVSDNGFYPLEVVPEVLAAAYLSWPWFLNNFVYEKGSNESTPLA